MDQQFILHGVDRVQLVSIKMCQFTACDKLTTYSSLTAKKCTLQPLVDVRICVSKHLDLSHLRKQVG